MALDFIVLLSEFNLGTSDEVSTLLKHCVHIPRWSTELLKQRPFASVEGLLKAAEQSARTWSWEEILAALNTHPRIGEKKAQALLSQQEQAFSDREQSALNADQDTLDAIDQGNLAYEKKYGFIFLIKASGLNSQDILTALTYRLKNDPEIEQRIVHQQLMEIALLRLSQEIQA